MKKLLVTLAVLLATILGIGGYFFYQDGLVPVPLADVADLFVPAKPEYGEDQARVEVLMPAGDRTEAFLASQSALPLIRSNPSGVWSGNLIRELAISRNGRRLRCHLRSGWRLQQGGELDASMLKAFWAPIEGRMGFQAKVLDATMVEIRFSERMIDAPAWLSRWLIPGTGPFIQKGSTLTRFEGFIYGRAGIAEIRVLTEPALLESHAWAAGLVSGRWAWTVFPGQITPEDMAKVRLAPYDEIRMKDGSIWFLSRRMRRLRPDGEDWTRTRLFGIWKGAMDLPYDPLGL